LTVFLLTLLIFATFILESALIIKKQGIAGQIFEKQDKLAKSRTPGHPNKN
jgi:hypothetical protein